VAEEHGERRPNDAEFGDEERIAKEEEAAADEAGSIGGQRDDSVDEAERPVAEGGGGESEGAELSEEELIDEAEHG
jgi:hypothetical protein